MFKKLISIILATALLASGCTISKKIDSQNVGNNTTQSIENNEENAVMEKDYIKLLYPDAGVEYWLVEEKKLPVDISAVVEELIKNEKNGIPKDTKILDIKIENRIAYINLSKEFEKLSLGDDVIWRNIYIIVNTLTLNKNLNIDSVQFLLEGKVEQFIGDTITDKPIPNNVELMKIY